jgi:hypothetical protein
MKRRAGLVTASLVITTAFGLLGVAGCDLPGKGESSNRYEDLNIQTKKLIDVLEKIQDENTAKQYETELIAAADAVREVQKRIADAAAKAAEKGGSGMGMVTNFRQASLFEQVGNAARREKERIEEIDIQASIIVNQAMDGIELPESDEF